MVRKAKLEACAKLVRAMMNQEQEKLTKLRDVHRVNIVAVRQKVGAVMLVKCYNQISARKAQQVLNEGIERIPLASYVPFPFEDYNSPESDLELNREEEVLSELANMVGAGWSGFS